MSEQTMTPEMDSGVAQAGVIEIDQSLPKEKIADMIFDAERRQIPYTMKGADRPAVEEKAVDTAVEQVADNTSIDNQKEDAASEENPLLKMIRGEKQEVEDVPAPVADWLKAKGYEDPKAILNEVPALRTQKTELEGRIKELEADLAYLEDLDEEAKNVIAMAKEKGKDWKKEILARPSMDFRLTFEKQDKREMLEAYAKGKFSDEEIEDYLSEDPDPTNKRVIDALLESVRPKYEQDRDGAINYREREAAQRKEIQQKFNASLEASVNYVFSAIPGSKAYETQIKEAIAGLQDRFYEKDGVTLKPSAALDAWFLSQREAIMEAKEAKIRKEAQDAATLSTLRRAEEKKPVPKGNATGSGAGKTKEQLADEIFKNRFEVPIGR